MKILLVANYKPDAQESMLRFANALYDGLKLAGVDVQIVHPEPHFKNTGASGFGKWLGYLDKFVLFPRKLRQLARDADIVHICDHSNAMYVQSVESRPQLVTCNDMLAIRSARGEFPQNRTGWSGRVLQSWILAGLKRARRLTCISAATQRDVMRLTGHSQERVSVTYMGQNFAYAPVEEISTAAETRRTSSSFDAGVFTRHGLPERPYVIHVGGTQWYKNRNGVLRMYAALQKQLGEETPTLLVVGKPLENPPAGVRSLSGVDNQQLAALYSGAELLLFPSLEEGFGWPIIEAQACGCRALTTNKAPMTEVGGDAAFYLDDPENADEGAAAIGRILQQNVIQRQASIARGRENAARFSTERMIREYTSIYHSLIR